ncbi:autophagy protein 6 [Naegleria gruberi]|uniref:Autophagy protein 6 n=1 Tax=Naegleria gruberi TaxID=5762 RepID=D2UY34_NAEGR|nr:autophagy protein 6 [Naegleria gruberi]EFC50725.1 autophagy protein 6 [Naegleria gruberi]|eukprot:XP_002683469.1 autophagy protein 6 [Naegleria gruberi strain NEG-M]
MRKNKGSLSSTRSVPNLSALRTNNNTPQVLTNNISNAILGSSTTTSTGSSNSTSQQATNGTSGVSNINAATTALSYYYQHTPLPPHHQNLLQSISSSEATPQLSADDVQQLSEMLYFPKYKKAVHSAVCYRCKHQVVQIMFETNGDEENPPKRAFLKVYDPSFYNLNYDQNMSSFEESENSDGQPTDNSFTPTSYMGTYESSPLTSLNESSGYLPTNSDQPSAEILSSSLSKNVSFALPRKTDAVKDPRPTTPNNPLQKLTQQDKKRFSFNPNAKKKEQQQLRQLQLEKEQQQMKLQQRMNQLNEDVDFLDKCVISNEEYEMNVEYVKQLYQYLSDVTQLDSPLCIECMEQVSSQLNQQLEKTKEEEAIYTNFKSKIIEESSGMKNEADLQNELDLLEEEEKLLRKELDLLQKEEEELSLREKHQTEKEDKFTNLQESYWKEYNDFHNELLLYNEEREAIQQRIIHVTKEMEKLNSTNVFNDAFHIWYEGHFGTINNFRLGRLPTQNVEWNEINAAWGQAALLLFSLSKHKHFAFSKYKIIPMGSFSRIETLDNKNSYDLFGGGSNGGLFWQSKFDKAMVAFLHCLKEIGTFAEKQDTYFELPYK